MWSAPSPAVSSGSSSHVLVQPTAPAIELLSERLDDEFVTRPRLKGPVSVTAMIALYLCLDTLISERGSVTSAKRAWLRDAAVSGSVRV